MRKLLLFIALVLPIAAVYANFPKELRSFVQLCLLIYLGDGGRRVRTGG